MKGGIHNVLTKLVKKEESGNERRNTEGTDKIGKERRE